MPPDLEGQTKKDQWAIENWGTKWGACECQEPTVSDAALRYAFCTAWSPLSPKLLKVLSARFPSLLFDLRYEEPSMAFRGQTVANNGAITTDWAKDTTEETLSTLG